MWAFLLFLFQSLIAIVLIGLMGVAVLAFVLWSLSIYAAYKRKDK